MKAIENFISNTKNFEGFTVSKTVTTKLIPVGKTRENIDKYEILSVDKQREDAFLKVKKLIDRIHKDFINEKLSEFEFVNEDLIELFNLYKQKENSLKEEKKAIIKLLEKKENDLRVQLVAYFKQDERFVKLFNKNLFGEILPAVCSKEEMQDVKIFDKFLTYFDNFNRLRQFLYSSEDKKNTVSYRIINENYPIFYKNLCILEEIEQKYSELFNDNTIKNFMEFCQNGFKCSSEFINKYNSFIQGIFDADGNVIQEGVNQAINKFKQKNEGVKIKYFKQLYKNILMDKVALFTIDSFDSTSEVKDKVKEFNDSIEKSVNNFISYLKKNSFDTKNLFVDSKNLASFSNIVCGKFFVLQNVINSNKDLKGKQIFSLRELEESLFSYNCTSDEQFYFDYTKYFEQLKSFKLEQLFEQIDFDKITDIQYDKTQGISIKNYVQSVLDYYNLLRLVSIKEDEESMLLDMDENFYFNLNKIIDTLSSVVRLYNKIRNYMTKSLKQERKLKLNFDCSVLLKGWTSTVEKEKNGMLFYDTEKDKYYLGIYNQKTKKEDFPIVENSNIKKMFLNMIPEPYKMLPHVCFSNKGIETFKPSEEILEGYKEGKHKKSSGIFDINFCHKLIDYYKSCISLREEWNCFTFNFKDTTEYQDTSEFFDDVAKGAYKVKLENIDENHLMNLVEEGKLFLFEIYNKYLSGKSKGNDNYTNIIRSLFDENINNVQLCAGASIYYRPALIKKQITHKKGSYLINKITKNGNTIGTEEYKSIYNHLNFGKELSSEAKMLLDSGVVIYKKADIDIIKDKRYTEENFSFNFPVKINYAAKELNVYQFNRKVLETIKDDKDINILSINRGVNNLIYAVLTDREGKVILDKSFNLISDGKRDVNFKHKLRQKADERKKSRESWQEIDSIKNIKEGYISLVVSEITRMMIDNNAILVMEDLSSSFKSKMQMIESNVYQQFETALFNKLSCVIFKDRKNGEAGSILHPYQLVPKFVSYESIFIQFGFVFLVNSAYISRIDSINSVINIFNFNELTNHEKRITFLKKFDFIGFKDGVFTFEYNLKNFDKEFSGEQKVIAAGKRVYWDKDKRTMETIDFNEIKEWLDIGEEKNYVEFLSKDTAMGIVKLILKVFEIVISLRSYMLDDWVYVSTDGRKNEFSNKSMDFIGAYNLAKKLIYMLKLYESDSKIKNVKTSDIINANL